MNYDEMGGKTRHQYGKSCCHSGGSGPILFFSHYFLTMAIAFLGIAAMLRDQFLAIARVECSVFLSIINWNRLNVFTLISVVKIVS